MVERSCALGCFAKTGKAMVVAVAAGPELVRKWDVALVPEEQERFVYHAAELMDLPEAAPFVERSTRAINAHTEDTIRAVLDELAADGVALSGAAVIGREVELPAPLEKILTAHSLLHAAEGVLYRAALVDAFAAHGIACSLVPRDELPALEPVLPAFGKVPPPWRKEHKEAALAALTVVRAGGRGSAPRTARAAPSRRRT
jgi:hypothetical protein